MANETLSTLPNFVTALANVVTAIGVVLAYLQYRASERVARIDQTLRLLTLGAPVTSYTLADEQNFQANLLKFFKGRYENSGAQMSESKAKELWNAGLHRDATPSDSTQEYLTARDELNRMESIAFAYKNRLGDRRLIAQYGGPQLVRSAAYFGALIKVAAGNQRRHSWQIIPEVVADMQREFPDTI